MVTRVNTTLGVALAFSVVVNTSLSVIAGTAPLLLPARLPNSVSSMKSLTSFSTPIRPVIG